MDRNTGLIESSGRVGTAYFYSHAPTKIARPLATIAQTSGAKSFRSVNRSDGAGKPTIAADTRWAKESTITCGESAKVVVEVVSTNWSDDYAMKLEDYEALGIAEYWLCDYLGLGGKRSIGSPKQPTFSVYQLNPAGEYQVKQFRGQQAIESLVFPELQLSLDQLLAAATEPMT